jgi:hypothetical protein
VTRSQGLRPAVRRDQFDALLGDVSCADAASVGMDDIDSFGGDAGPPASCAVVDCGEGSPFGG